MSRPVPPMTNSMGKLWRQPGAWTMDFDKVPGYVIMTKASFEMLADYSRSYPSGVYAGKMWRCHDFENTWYLAWYEDIPDMPTQCAIKRLPIMLQETLDLIGG